MNFEKKLFIVLISILIIVLLFIFTKNYHTYKEVYDATTMPFSSLSILNNDLDLKANERVYNLNIDCSSLKDENTQIISYQLLKEATESNLSISTKIYNNDQVLTDTYDHITSINATISVTNPNKTYEQVFIINATCE